MGLGVQRAEELERLAVDFGGGASAFAIDGQRGDPQVLKMGAEPIGDEPIQLDRFQALEDSPDGRFARSNEFASFGASAGAQAAELILIESLGKLAEPASIWRRSAGI